MSADPRNPMTYASSNARIERIETLLQQRPMTTSALAKCIPAAERSTQRWLREMKARKMVHITRWVRSQTNRCMPVFAAGGTTDVPRPPSSTNAAAQRRYKIKRAGLPVPPIDPIRTTWRFDATNRPAEGQKAMK